MPDRFAKQALRAPLAGAPQGVTVLIAAYNAAPFLQRAVTSALEQTLRPVEVIIVDDGSTDGTAEVARGLAAANHLVRLICRDRNGGPSVARNAGLDRAGGEWVAILDADDAFLPDRLERLIRLAEETRADVVADNFIWYDAVSGLQGAPGLSTAVNSELIDKYTFVACARPYAGESDWGLLKPVFRRAFLDDHNLRYAIHSRHGEDFLLMLDVFLAGGRYFLARTPGYLYTNRSSGFSRTIVDYDTMAAHTATLIDDQRVRSDKRLTALLVHRYWSVKSLGARVALRSYFREGKYLQIFFSAIRDRFFLGALLSLTQERCLRSIVSPVRERLS
jgi:succinoglycan biosynthesis protein ExoO